MYVQDYDETFPYLMMDGRNNDDNTGFSKNMEAGTPVLNNVYQLFMEAKFQPYIKNTGIFGCPTLRPDPVKLDAAGVPINAFGSYAYGYGGLNAGCGPGALGGHTATPLELFLRLAPFNIGCSPNQAPRFAHVLATGCDPKQYFIAGQSLAAIQKPAATGIAFCDSYGAHQGYTDSSVTPKCADSGSNGQEQVGATEAVFTDGHAKYQIGKFWDLVAIALPDPNK
jgi:hypothetical protein